MAANAYTRVNVITNAKSCENLSTTESSQYAVLLSGENPRPMDLRLDKQVKMYLDDPDDYKDKS